MSSSSSSAGRPPIAPIKRAHSEKAPQAVTAICEAGGLSSCREAAGVLPAQGGDAQCAVTLAAGGIKGWGSGIDMPAAGCQAPPPPSARRASSCAKSE
jgi:hypothetical protein